ncbi:MAG: YcxB family protein [Pseudomonadota bacterium]
MSADLAPISFEVRRSKADFFGAIWANCMNGPRLIFIIAYAAILAAVLFGFETIRHVPFAWLSALAIFVVLIAVFLGAYAAISWFAATKAWSAPGGQGAVLYTLSPDQLAVKSDYGSGDTKWTVWKKAFETKSLIVIRHHMNLMHIIPKRDLTDETRRHVKALLSLVLNGNVKFRPEAAA